VSLQKHSTVSILNPMPGGVRYTSLKSAKRYVDRGRAVWVGSSAIRFDHSTQQRDMAEALRRMRQPWRYLDDDKAVDQLKHRALPWNGADTRDGVFHRPFEASVFPRVG
jgi:hypothetical protein